MTYDDIILKYLLTRCWNRWEINWSQSNLHQPNIRATPVPIDNISGNRNTGQL